jgi:hypothetical protein
MACLPVELGNLVITFKINTLRGCGPDRGEGAELKRQQKNGAASESLALQPDGERLPSTIRADAQE